jgi:hypothetical protein
MVSNMAITFLSACCSDFDALSESRRRHRYAPGWPYPQTTDGSRLRDPEELEAVQAVPVDVVFSGSWLEEGSMIAKMVLKTFPGHSTDAVFLACGEAVKSLGHEVEVIEAGDPYSKVEFRAIVGGKRDRKRWSVMVSKHPEAGSVATVSRWAFIGGSQSKVNAVGQEIFQTMDTLLA